MASAVPKMARKSRASASVRRGESHLLLRAIFAGIKPGVSAAIHARSSVYHVLNRLGHLRFPNESDA
jgi:hypothetical protein